MNKNINKKSGFSMLELVVVMLVMGTLRGVAISKMGGSDIGAVKVSVKSDIRNAITRINSCFSETMSYLDCDNMQISDNTPKDNRKIGSMFIEASKGNIINIDVASDRRTIPEIKVWSTYLEVKTPAKYILTYNNDTPTIGKFHN